MAQGDFHIIHTDFHKWDDTFEEFSDKEYVLLSDDEKCRD
jgi:hypothetical protein